MRKVIGLLTILGTALAVLVVGLVAQSNTAKTVRDSGSALAPFWALERGQLAVEDPTGIFGLKAVLTTPEELLLFYAMRSTQEGVPEIAASSSANSGQGTGNLATIVQPLGRLGEYDVGVIHLSWTNQPQQTISLQVSAPTSNSKSSKPVWRLAPLKQVARYTQEKQTVDFIQTGGAPSLVEIDCGYLGNGIAGAFKLFLTAQTQPKAVQPIYVRVDRGGVVSQITEDDYKALTTPILDSSTASDDPGKATPAPRQEQ